MSCKKHPTDQSSSVGVCASCLRERLVALTIAAAAADPPLPSPLAFPSSVSPYVAPRKSRDPNDPGCIPPAKTKKNHRRHSFLSHLFRSKSEKFDSDTDLGASEMSSVSPSWLSFFPGGRRPKSRLSSVADKKSSCVSDRRISQVHRSEGEAMDFDDSSPLDSGYSSDSSPVWKKTPANGVNDARLRPRPAYPSSMSGLAFCLSPLVRASPGRHCKQKAAGGASCSDLGYSGEIRPSSARPHISAAASFCANRSRKLADFGRTNLNR